MNKNQNVRRVVLAMVLMVLCTGSLFSQNRKLNVRDLTWEQAMEAAVKEKKFIFVDVYRDNCDYCDEALSKVFTRDSIADLYNENFVSIRINMNTEAGKAFAPKLQMLMYPAYVFYSADGEQLTSTTQWAVLKDYGQAMQAANTAITNGNIRLNNSRTILFEETFSWEAALEKSRKENKPIFIDAYTTWCRPCIKMDRNVFTLNKVADFYNEHFINLKMDAEKGEGIEVRKKFGVKAYPTYLYLDSNGELLNEGSGYTDADPFIEYGKKALEKFIEKNTEGRGIQFEKGSWEEIKAKARVENKLIFFDAYTTWCGPCKKMAKEVFTDSAVADFFNEHFINAKFDMEKGEGIALKDQFEVAAYPTYIYLDADENEIHRTVGSTTAENFLQHAGNALSEDKNLAFLSGQYAEGDRSPELIKAYLGALKVAYLGEQMDQVAKNYLDGLRKKDLLKEENWLLIKDYLKDPAASSFQYLVRSREKFYKGYDRKEIDDKIYNVYLFGANRFVTYNEDDSINFDEEGFEAYLAEIEKSGVARKDQIITYATINNLRSRQKWEQYAEAIDKGLDSGVIEKTPLMLYNYALMIKRYGKTPELLERGAHWAFLGGQAETNEQYKATYFNLQADLLEKAGKPEAARQARERFQKEDLENAQDKRMIRELIIKEN